MTAMRAHPGPRKLLALVALTAAVAVVAGCSGRVEGGASAGPTASAIVEGPNLIVADPILDGVSEAEAAAIAEMVQADAWLAERTAGHSARLVCILAGDSKAPGTRAVVADYTTRTMLRLSIASGTVVEHAEDGACPDYSPGENAAAASIAIADPDVAAAGGGADLEVMTFAGGSAEACWRCVAVFLHPVSGAQGGTIVAIVELSTGEVIDVVAGA